MSDKVEGQELRMYAHLICSKASNRRSQGQVTSLVVLCHPWSDFNGRGGDPRQGLPLRLFVDGELCQAFTSIVRIRLGLSSKRRGSSEQADQSY